MFYTVNTPFSKILLKNIAPTFLAALLYLGARIGIGIIYLFHIKNEDKNECLTKKDLPYTIGMILLDIAAPIFLLVGINYGTLHTHVITHSHNHKHFSDSEKHTHKHEKFLNSEEHRLAHC